MRVLDYVIRSETNIGIKSFLYFLFFKVFLILLVPWKCDPTVLHRHVLDPFAKQKEALGVAIVP